jgi:integrase
MNGPFLTSAPQNVDSSSAISVRAKEKIRMQAQRYQRGSLSILKRKSQPDAWVFRYYAEENGRRVYKKTIIGSVIEFPKRKDAEKQMTQLRVEINDGAAFAPITVEQLAIHFKNVEVPLKAHSTGESYKNFLDVHVVPRWGQNRLRSIEGIEVENWLRTLKRKDGEPASPATKAKIRNLMSAVFAHAIRYGWAAVNPIRSVRVSAKRLRTPDILTPHEFQDLIRELAQRERVMVLLAASTGLRRGELIALRWRDVDFESNLANVTHSIWHNVEGDTKTEASRKPLPIPTMVVEELKRWRATSLYRSEDDYLFPSIAKNGAQPVQPDMILKRHIRPALERLNVKKKIGWHSFRHGLSNLLRQRGVDVKVAQELLRHANSRITLDIYQQTVTAERRAAQTSVCDTLIGTSISSTLQHPDSEQKEEVIIVNH